MDCFEQSKKVGRKNVAIRRDLLEKLREMSSIENKLDSAILSIYDVIDGETDSLHGKYRGKETTGIIRELEKVLLILQEQVRKLQDGELDNEMF